MLLIPSSLTELLVALLILTTLLIILYFKHSYTYWKRKRFPYLPPTIPFGNTTTLKPSNLGLHLGIISSKWYRTLKAAGHKFGGVYLFTRPFLVICDPQLVHRITVTDFHHFNSRGLYYNHESDPLSGSLLTYAGKEWKKARVKMSPTFSSGKLRAMCEVVIKCAGNMRAEIERRMAHAGAVDLKEIAACFTTDVIGAVAFGVECNSLTYPDAEFRRYGRIVFSKNPWVNFVQYLTVVAPRFSKTVGLGVTDKGAMDFFMTAVKEAVAYRRENDFRRNDFLQMLIDGGAQADAEFLGQCWLFFTASYETSSSTMNFALYELARNQNVQRKAREEIQKVLKERGRLDYDSVKELKYLQQVVDETLRMYPPKPNVPRECLKDYVIPGTDLVIEKGVAVCLPVYGLHHDPEYFPEPEKFDPERFSEENKGKIVPNSYMPFGDGPMSCLGLRYGLMQVKIGLASILRDFVVKPEENWEPIDFYNEAFLLIYKNQFQFVLEKVE